MNWLKVTIMPDRATRTHDARPGTTRQNDCFCQGTIAKEEAESRSLDLQGVGTFAGLNLLSKILAGQFVGPDIQIFQALHLVGIAAPVDKTEDLFLVDAACFE